MTKSNKHILRIPVWFHSTEAVSINKVRYDPSTEVADFFNGHLRETQVEKRLNEEVSLPEKINKLNNLCDGTLGMTSYMDGALWVVGSYGDSTPLDPTHGSVNAMSFEEAVDKALKIVIRGEDVTK